ncbi:MAG TPA: hypothetical protein VF100_13130 [Thermoanaerobaculia bacterium]
MANELPRSNVSPPPSQNVVIIDGDGAQGSVQAPTTTGNIWFAFEVGGGSATLNVNFNGTNYPNVPVGQYSLTGLHTPLGLEVTVNGSVKLAWAQM